MVVGSLFYIVSCDQGFYKVMWIPFDHGLGLLTMTLRHVFCFCTTLGHTYEMTLSIYQLSFTPLTQKSMSINCNATLGKRNTNKPLIPLT